MLSLATWIVWQLRKASYRWPARYGVWKAAKVAPNTFKCAKCGKDYKKENGKRNLTLDHIIPCKDPTRPQAFQEDILNCQCGVCDYIRKMFCTEDGMQILCKTCHPKKTKKEMTIRKKARKAKKAVKNVSK